MSESIFWDALPKNLEANVESSEVESCFFAIIVLMLAGISREDCLRFAHDLLGSRKMRETAYFTQEEFFEAILLTADIFLEELDISSACAYVKFLQNRLAHRGDEEFVEVRFFSALTKGVQPTQDTIFCEESYHHKRASVKVNLQQTRFRPVDRIRPLGATTDEVLMSVANDKGVPELDSLNQKLQVAEAQTITTMATRTEKLFHVRFCILDQAGYPCKFSPAIRSPYFLEVLQNKQQQRVVLNQRSLFIKEIELDKVHELTKRWTDKLIVPQPGPLDVQGKPFEEIFDVLIKAKFQNIKVEAEESLAESRLIDFQSSDTFPSISSEKFKHFETRETRLPIDNLDPYADDLIEYAKERPPHILVHGKPKVGKTKFCTLLAKKLDLEIIDLELFIQNFLKKVADGEENPQMDDDNAPIEFLKPWERALITNLRKGDRATPEQLIELMNSEIQNILDH